MSSYGSHASKSVNHQSLHFEMDHTLLEKLFEIEHACKYCMQKGFHKFCRTGFSRNPLSRAVSDPLYNLGSIEFKFGIFPKIKNFDFEIQNLSRYGESMRSVFSANSAALDPLGFRCFWLSRTHCTILDRVNLNSKFFQKWKFSTLIFKISGAMVTLSPFFSKQIPPQRIL